jgi:cytosine/adenosine deaminase-related metal-dependent hydrolase
MIRILEASLILALTLVFRPSAQEPPLAFVDVSLVSMDREQILSHQTVVVVGGRIAQVGPAASVKVPGDARRIDGRGKFLMPGRADMHVHFIRSPLPDKPQPRTSSGPRKTTRPASASTENAQENRALGLLFVANGITTVRNM